MQPFCLPTFDPDWPLSTCAVMRHIVYTSCVHVAEWTKYRTLNGWICLLHIIWKPLCNQNLLDMYKFASFLYWCSFFEKVWNSAHQTKMTHGSCHTRQFTGNQFQAIPNKRIHSHLNVHILFWGIVRHCWKTDSCATKVVLKHVKVASGDKAHAH